MKFFLKRRFIIGGCFSALAILDIFANVLSGVIDPKMMIVGILMLVIGINTIYNVVTIEKSNEKTSLIETAEGKANSVTLFVLQIIFSVAIAVTAVVNLFVESYGAVFMALIVAFGALLIFSYLMETILIKHFVRLEKRKQRN